jgi:hypothetical protein
VYTPAPGGVLYGSLWLGRFNRSLQLINSVGVSSAYQANGIVADGRGAVYVTGINIGSVLHRTAWLGKFDANLGLNSQTTIGPGGLNDSGNAVALDGSGNVYVTGAISHYTPVPIFSNGQWTWTFVSGGTDIFVTKHDSNLNVLSSATFRGAPTQGMNAGASVLVSNGSVYVAGQIDVTPATNPNNGGGAFSPWLGAYDLNLNLRSSTSTAVPPCLNDGVGVHLDSAGHVYVTASNAIFPAPSPKHPGLSSFLPGTLALWGNDSFSAINAQPFGSYFDGSSFYLVGHTFVSGSGIWIAKFGLPGSSVQGLVPAQGGGVLQLSGTKLNVPAGALAQDMQLSIAPAALDSATQQSQDLSLYRHSLAAISTGVQFGPEGTVFSTPVTITIGFNPQSLSQGTNPASLAVYYWNPQADDWQIMPSILDASNFTVSAQTTHFSLYQVLASAPASVSNTVEAVQIACNPLRSSCPLLIFRNLPAGARLRIYALTGALVKDLNADGSGNANWDGTNQSGQPGASGVYFVFAQGAGTTKTFKVAIER